MDQRELVERARGGDHDAFAVLAGAFVARLDSAARLILRDHELARDAVQEGFLAAWRGLPASAIRSLRGVAAPLVFRSCIDVIRRRGRRPIEVGLLPLDGPAIGDIASAIADRDLLDAALERLQPEQRVVVVMHYYLGMPLPDVASALGIPIGTAKSRHHRSLRPMRLTINNDLDSAPASGWRAVRMTAFDRIEPRLPELMAELAPRRFPTTSTTCSGRPAERGSGLPGRPLKGGFPWTSSHVPSRSGARRCGPLLILLLIGLLIAGALALYAGIAADPSARAIRVRLATGSSSSVPPIRTSRPTTRCQA